MADTPNILKRIQLAAQVFRRGMPTKAAPYYWPTSVNGRVQWTLNDFESYIREGFSLNAVIYTAEKYKFQAISQVIWRAYTGDPDQPELAAPDDALTRLLARPNHFQSQAEWMALNMVYLDMGGNSYNFLDWVTGEPLPRAIYPLRPDRVRLVTKGADMLGYVYIPEGKNSNDGAVAILPKYMMHVKYPNPLDPYEGMGEGLSPMAPLAQSGDVDNSLTTFLKNIFDRGTMPFGAIEMENSLDADTAARLR
jgi:phage portal protein BeeE